MKKLPSAWHIPQDPVCRSESMACGETWRISILTENLFRLEYSPSGVFEDRATQFALNRNFPACPFQKEDSPDELVISTAALRLRYDKRPFSGNGLCITMKKNGSVWHYGENPDNLGGTVRTLDGVDGSIELEPGVLSRKGFAVVDDSQSLALDENGWVQPRAEGNADIYVFAYGRNYRLCLKDFYRLSGPVPLLPRYALGNWWSRYHRYTEQSYKELIERFESEKIPLTVSVIDMDWHLTDIDPSLGGGWTGYTWNRQLFPDPAGFLSWLHGKNLKTTLNLHPADGIRSHEEAYGRIAKRMGIDSGNPVAFDAANPDFLQAYFEEVLHPMEEEGVDFWWIDWQQGTKTKVAGLDPLWILNHFHYLDSAKRSGRALAFSRYAGLGSHRYPVGFSGDTVVTWASLDFQPYFTATASNAGYGWWSNDIGGHTHGIRDDELAVRWVQLGVFSPINRLHSTNNPFNSKEPWNFNRRAQLIMTEFLRLRHRLLPYLYAMNRRASFESEPLIQPLYYAEPENSEAYQKPNEFYFGTELLVCPITSPVNREAQAAGFKAWLPPGLWIDFFNGCIYKGGRLLELWRSLESMPVLAKAGAIVPMAADENPAVLELAVFAGASHSFRLWEDDDDENWAWTDFAFDWDVGQFTISPAAGNVSAIPTVRSWNLRFYGCAESKFELSSGGKKVPAEGVYDPKKNCLTVSVPVTPVNAELRITFDKAILAKNDTSSMLFDFLNSAWIEYDVKLRVYNMVQSGKSLPATLAALQTLNLPSSIYSGISEILCAYEESC